jgi:hypothetical protein
LPGATLTNAARRITAPGGMENQPVSRASLVDVYISRLNLTAVAIVADGRRCRIETGGEIAPGEKIEARFYFKPTHADLVLMTIDKEGLSDLPPAASA